MLTLDVSDNREETGKSQEDGLPCMMQTRPSMSVDGEQKGQKLKAPKEEERKTGGCTVIGSLLDTFTGKDIKALTDKVSSLQGDIRKGFNEDTYFVKSA